MDSRKRLLITLLAAATVANLALLRPIDVRLSANYAALNRSGTSDIVAIGSSESTYIEERYGFQFALAKIAPESTVILPESGSLSRNEHKVRFLTFGRVSEVRHAKYDYNADSLLPSDLSPELLLSSVGDETKTFRVAAIDANTDRKQGTPWLIVRDNRDKSSSQTNKKIFIYMQWDRGDNAKFLILIEKQLLPDEVVEGIGL